jgi:hypothetical protein
MSDLSGKDLLWVTGALWNDEWQLMRFKEFDGSLTFEWNYVEGRSLLNCSLIVSDDVSLLYRITVAKCWTKPELHWGDAVIIWTNFFIWNISERELVNNLEIMSWISLISIFRCSWVNSIAYSKLMISFFLIIPSNSHVCNRQEKLNYLFY